MLRGHGRADGARDVVVAGRDVGDERPEHVERAPRRRAPAPSACSSGSGPAGRGRAPRSSPGRRAPRPCWSARRAIFSSANCASSLASARQPGRSPSPSEKRHVVLLEDLADVVEVRRRAGSACGCAIIHCARSAPPRLTMPVMRSAAERHDIAQHAGVDGHVVHALLPPAPRSSRASPRGVEVLHVASRARAPRRSAPCRSGPGCARRMASRMRWMSPPVERSITVSAPYLRQTCELLELLVDVGGDGGVADVRVDLARRGDADGHRLELRVVDVGGDDHPPARDLLRGPARDRASPAPRRRPSPPSRCPAARSASASRSAVRAAWRSTGPA